MLPTVMLSSELVSGARKTDRTHDILTALLAAVQKYNMDEGARVFAGDAGRHIRALQLNDIMLCAGSYLVSKPPRAGHTKSQMRWDALSMLAGHAATDAAAHGFITVRGPTDMRKVDGDKQNWSVWLELLDPSHRPPQVLSDSFNAWLNDSKALTERIGFFKWLTYNGDNVDYMSEATAAKYHASFHEGRLQFDDGPVDTAQMTSAELGTGWGIFVYSTDKALYIGDHHNDAGELLTHHSSFLSGRPVIGAGEIMVQNGEIKALTAMTGHYWTPMMQMQLMCLQTPAIRDDVLIRPFGRDSAEYDAPWFIRCGAFRRKLPSDRPGQGDVEIATAAEIRQQLPYISAKLREQLAKLD